MLRSETFPNTKSTRLVSCCGTVGSAVTSDTRGHEFESSHQQLLLNNYLLSTDNSKDENKLKEARNSPFRKVCVSFIVYGTKKTTAFRSPANRSSRRKSR